MPITNERVADYVLATLRFLSLHESALVQDVETHLADTLRPGPEESGIQSNGQPEWAYRNRWTGTRMVHAGFISKDGSGIWSITDAGRSALSQYPDPASLFQGVLDRERLWKDTQSQARRRAWLVRGSSVLGVNVVPEWLQEGFCSLAGSQLRPIEPGVDAEELRAWQPRTTPTSSTTS